MTLDTFFHPYSLVFLAGLALMIYCTQIKNRRKMMAVKFFSEACNGLYMVLMNGLTGGLAAWIAGLGGLIQALTPARMMKKTMWPRTIGAVILSLLAIYVSYKDPFDLLPIGALIFCRFMELSHNPERIRLAYYISGFPWMIYLYVNGIYFMLVSVIIINIMFLVGLIRNRQRKTIVPMDPV